MATNILSLLIQLLNILMFAMIGRALLSWVDPGQQWAISRVLAQVTDPIVLPLRRVIPLIGMFDISFIVAILLIQVLQRLLVQAMYA